MKWLDLCDDPSLKDIPAKIELNKDGEIVMSPTQNRHGYFAGEIAGLLRELMGSGKVLVELAVETEDSTKVADVAWASAERVAKIKYETECSIAPEICVEVRSVSNTDDEMDEKRALYFERGAQEVWVCQESGEVHFFSHLGQLQKSQLAPDFPNKIKI